MMKFILALLFSVTASATLNEVDKTQIYSKSLLVNGGFENGKAKWTPNDTADFAVTGSSPMIGLYHATWDADASADTLITTAVAIPAGMYGRNAVASCLFTVASGTGTHEIQAYDGSTVLAETSITSSTTPARASVNFIMPSSGNIQLRIYANADEPSVAIDDCYLGPAEGFNLSGVSGAMFIGSAYIPGTTNCLPTRTNTALGAFTSDADCPGPTVEANPGPGIIQTTDADLPRFTVNNLPPGRYIVEMEVPSTTGTSAVNSEYAITDGTTTSGNNSAAIGSSANELLPIKGYFNYTTSGDRTFEVHGASASGTVRVAIDHVRAFLRIRIYRFPTSNELAYTADQMAQSWSGYHEQTCSWARTSTTTADPTADATCTLTERSNSNFGTVTTYTVTNAMPGIVFTPKRVGRYYACAVISAEIGSAGVAYRLHLTDGTNIVATTINSNAASYMTSQTLCGIVVASSLSSISLRIQSSSASGTVTINSSAASANPIEWSIFALDNAFPQPAIQNGVTHSGGNQIGIYSAAVSSADAVSNEVGGDWINGNCTDATTGRQTCAIQTGIFSGTPNCWGAVAENTTDAASVTIISATSSSVTFETASSAGAANLASNVFCLGPK